jgi:DNA mismatch endonuclease (patch repair protein)
MGNIVISNSNYTQQRSFNMSRIRSRGNRSTEMAMIALFRQHGITGWLRHFPLIGRPDFVFKKQRVAVFVDGCFWHGCAKHYRQPKNNNQYWNRKLQMNKKRDQEITATLREKGWDVIRIWEHDIRNCSGILFS